jgi:glycerol-3-phosphate dehydrogenase
MDYVRPAREPISDRHFDVAVIGGGINGVAIARECALAGKRVLLIEKHDFAAGTTSRATRIIHGGLRYLERGELGLVRESLRERERLLSHRAHLVRPLEFVLALPTHGLKHSALAIRTALWLYERLGKRPDARGQHAQTAESVEAALDRGLKLSLFPYEDAQCEFPERLVAEWLGEALRGGAVVRNYTEALEIQVREGRAHGVSLRDRLDRSEIKISADWIINATGPWADETLRRSQLDQQRLISGVRGSHIVLPRFAGAPSVAVYTEARDGRPTFVIPWAEQILVGTTEVLEQDAPENAEPASHEIAYLFDGILRLFPRSGVKSSDIRYSYAGVRPLAFTAEGPLNAISRRHQLHDHLEEGVAGLITVVGGKLTTAAALARTCARAIGIHVAEPSITVAPSGSALGIRNVFAQWAGKVAEIAKISASSAVAIAEWHGARAMCVARTASADPILRRPLCEHSEHIVAEAVETVQHESAITLADILLRRVPVSLGACWNEECSRTAATRIGAALGWTDRQQGLELEHFTEERMRFLHPGLQTENKNAVCTEATRDDFVIPNPPRSLRR